MTDEGVVASFLRREPSSDGLWRNSIGQTAQVWPHVIPFTLKSEAGTTEKRVLAAYYEASIPAPRGDYLIAVFEGEVIGLCATEDLRTRFIRYGDQWVLPHLMPPYSAYIVFHGCEVCGTPFASFGTGFNVRKGVMGSLFCRDHTEQGSPLRQ